MDKWDLSWHDIDRTDSRATRITFNFEFTSRAEEEMKEEEGESEEVEEVNIAKVKEKNLTEDEMEDRVTEDEEAHSRYT